MKKTFMTFLFLLGLLFALQAQNIQSDYTDGVVYVKVKAGYDIPSKDNFDTKTHLEEFKNHPSLSPLVNTYGIYKVQKPFRTPALKPIYKVYFSKQGAVEKLLKDLESMDFVVYACKSTIYRSTVVPDDVHVNQWYMPLIQAFDAWDITTGDPLVKVAIVDDAVKISHPDLSPIIWHNPLEVLDSIDNDNNGFVDDITGWDVANDDNDPEPPLSHWMYQFSDMIFTHGTHCSGIAGAATNNGTGIASIGNGISILPVKCTADNSILPLAIDEGPLGIDYAIMAGADVISLSWGGGQSDPVVADAVNAALDTGIIVVAAAGNDGNTSLSYPASLDGVISVGAITKNDIIASFSQRNNKVSVMAPGDSIWSTIRENNGYMYMEGTSMACPMVAGLCGLLKSLDTSFTADQIKACLIAGCDNIDSLNPSAAGLMGAGRINALKSLQCLQSQQGLIEPNNSNTLFVYPNPALTALFATFDPGLFASLEVKDLMGRTCASYAIPSGQTIMEVNVTNLSDGLYLLLLKGKQNVAVYRKFIVRKGF